MQITALFSGEFSPIMPVAVLASVLLMFINGWTDAPATIAAAVTSGALTVKKACALSAGFNLLGAFFMSVFGSSVAVSVYSLSGVGGIAKEKGSIVITAAMLTVVVFAVIAFFYKIPTSESHALFAALAGASSAVIGFKAFLNIEWLKIFSGILISTMPLIFFADTAATFLVKKTENKSQTLFKRLQTVGVMALSFSHGAQDGQKFAGVFTVCYVLALNKNAENIRVPVFAVILSALLISMGMFCCGSRIISSFKNIAPKNAAAGFAADFVSSIALIVCSLLGIPVSTTHAKAAAILGAGAKTAVSVKTFRGFMLWWIITFPACAALGYIISKALLFLLLLV